MIAPRRTVSLTLTLTLTFTPTLLASACAHQRASSETDEPPPCEHDAEIERHRHESVRLSEAMHEAREKLAEAERALESATTEEEREALRREIGYQEGAEAVYFTGADEHYFAAQDLEEECENPKRRRRRR